MGKKQITGSIKNLSRTAGHHKGAANRITNGPGHKGGMRHPSVVSGGPYLYPQCYVTASPESRHLL